MTEDRLPLAELLAKAGDGDFLRSVAQAVAPLLMETEVMADLTSPLIDAVPPQISTVAA